MLSCISAASKSREARFLPQGRCRRTTASPGGAGRSSPTTRRGASVWSVATWTLATPSSSTATPSPARWRCLRGVWWTTAAATRRQGSSSMCATPSSGVRRHCLLFFAPESDPRVCLVELHEVGFTHFCIRRRTRSGAASNTDSDQSLSHASRTSACQKQTNGRYCHTIAGADYLVKAHTGANSFVAQVCNTDIDGAQAARNSSKQPWCYLCCIPLPSRMDVRQNWTRLWSYAGQMWTRPEQVKEFRPVYTMTTAQPGEIMA